MRSRPIALAVACLFAALPLYAADIAPGKFIPSAVVVYGGYNKCTTAQAKTDRVNLAKFDLLSTDASFQTCWSSDGLNSWKSLKAINPHLKIVLYRIGPGEYNTSKWGVLGDGWSWIQQNHGDSAPDRWTAKGITYGTYLQSTEFSNEMLMQLGNANWQAYWYEQSYADWWGGQQVLPNGKHVDAAGADGIFSDNTGYYIPYCGRRLVKLGTKLVDNPVGYYANGSCLANKWKADLNAFFDRAVPWLDSKGLMLVANFGWVENAPQLEAIEHPPFAVMDECSFSCPWGSFQTETNWKRKVDAMLSLKRVRAWIHNGLKLHARTTATGTARMDVASASGATGWDALWFDLCSFLMGYDDVRGNAYFSYIPGGYDQVLWFDELDPRYLHLGRALGSYARVQGVYLREFEDGWAVANPTATNATGVAVPRGRARVVCHANLAQADTAALVTAFDLPAHRGVILLKQGHRVGNGDNPASTEPSHTL